MYYFIDEGECFIRVSKHEKIDESTGQLLINIRSSTVILLEIDFQTHVFGSVLHRISWPNEATQLVNYLMHY